MSFMILIHNSNGTVISADSRLTTIKNNKIEYNDNFNKLFYNKKNNIVWGITGIYGNDKSVIKDINNYMENDINTALRLIRMNLIPITNGITNIFVATKDIYYIIDIDRDVNIRCFSDNNMFFAGQHCYMKDYFELSDINDISILDMVKKSNEITRREISIDAFIGQQNPHYRQSMNGNVMTVAIDGEGNITTYINEQKKEF